MIDKNDIKNIDVTAESFRGRDNTDDDKSESVINPLAKGDIYEGEETSPIALEVTDGNKDINISHLKGDMLTEKRIEDTPVQDEEERKKEAKRQIKEEEKKHQEEEREKELRLRYLRQLSQNKHVKTSSLNHLTLHCARYLVATFSLPVCYAITSG